MKLVLLALKALYQAVNLSVAACTLVKCSENDIKTDVCLSSS